MDILSIILIIIIGYIIYIFANSSTYVINQKQPVQNKMPNKMPNKISNKMLNKTKSNIKKRVRFATPNNSANNSANDSVDNIIDDIVSWDGSKDSNVTYDDEINPNFIDIKFHNDYRDLITAINNLVPDKKQLFNLANTPLVYSEPEASEVKNMILDFIGVVNSNIKTEVPSHRVPNSGWDEAIPDPTVESGWSKVQKSLGLQPSLWGDPAGKAPVKLIAVPYVQKYETEDEIKFSCDIILQKVNVADQILIKASFVQDKRPLHDENNFFISKSIEMNIAIEEVYVLGYLSKGGNDAKLIFDKDMEKFYDLDQMEYNNMMDPKYIQKILMEKYKNRTEEMEQRNAMLDEEGQAFHRQLPHVYDYSNIRGTRTIFDDFNTKKKFY
ncbi:MAG: hypothetical protein Homavirus37_4 [Homavirus sp.]|uniref:Uncharacterized protein n=1 Tax=Homavirus sp. TaxID=2487769 RepID=A0A3G5A537_9VIRU|nr:MAG: hypothetical protein Homavirus37_4 [Homavirus sp.]